MSDSAAVARATRAIERFRERVEQPRALTLRAPDRAALLQATERVAAQLGGSAEWVLTIALAGGSGVGKSTIINALAGATIAEAAAQRPCTTNPTVYHHRDVPDGALPPDLAGEARCIQHDRPELRYKVVVDTPDLDTFATHHRAATRALLKAAGLVLYVFTPEKYWDERVWSVIREEHRFSACLALLNKSDTVPAATLDSACAEIRRRFAELGKPDIVVLRIAAAVHVPAADGRLSTTAPAVLDEFSTLRAYIEHELHEGDIARMRREQRIRVVEHLEAELTHAVPADLIARLDAVDHMADAESTEAGRQVALALSDTFGNLEAELRPQLEVRRHQLFTGPFRIWLSLGDFFSFSLPRVVKRWRAIAAPEADGASLLSFTGNEAIDSAERASAGRLRDAIYSNGLPVERWNAIASESAGVDIPKQIAIELQGRFDAATLNSSPRVRWVARAASAIGTVVPVALAVYALVTVLRRMADGNPGGGLDLLALVFTLTVLSYILLHTLTRIALWGTHPAPVREIGPQSARAVLARRFRGWTARFRAEVEDDVSALREPVAILRALAESPIAAPAYIAAPHITPEKAGPQLSDEQSDTTPKPQGADMFVTSAATAEVIDSTETAPDVRPERVDESVAAPAIEPAPKRQPLRPSEIFKQAVERHSALGARKP